MPESAGFGHRLSPRDPLLERRHAIDDAHACGSLRWLRREPRAGPAALRFDRDEPVLLHDRALQLTRYDDRGWRAAFYVCDVENSATNAKTRRGCLWSLARADGYLTCITWLSGSHTRDPSYTAGRRLDQF